MLFSEALESLQQGKYVCRPDWKKVGEYLALLPGMQTIWKIMTIPNANAGNWLPLVNDMTSTDWEIIEKVEPVKEPEA